MEKEGLSLHEIVM